MGIYRLFKPKTKSSTYDELVLNFVDASFIDKETVYFDGHPMFIRQQDRDIDITYCDKQIRIITSLSYGQKPITISDAEIFFYDFSQDFIHNNASMLISLEKATVYLRDKQTNPVHEYDIQAPFSILNEIDFFNIEVQNPSVPLNTKAFVKFTTFLIEEMKKWQS